MGDTTPLVTVTTVAREERADTTPLVTVTTVAREERAHPTDPVTLSMMNLATDMTPERAREKEAREERAATTMDLATQSMMDQAMTLERAREAREDTMVNPATGVSYGGYYGGKG